MRFKNYLILFNILILTILFQHLKFNFDILKKYNTVYIKLNVVFNID